MCVAMLKGRDAIGGRTVAGAEGLRDALNSLRTDAARTALRYASRKAAGVIQDEAETRAPVGSESHRTYKKRLVAPGFLSRNIKTKVSYNRQHGSVIAKIGPSAEAFYGTQFLEVGTSKIPKQPWLVPSYTSKLGEVEGVFVSALKAAIARAVIKGKTR